MQQIVCVCVWFSSRLCCSKALDSHRLVQRVDGTLHRVWERNTHTPVHTKQTHTNAAAAHCEYLGFTAARQESLLCFLGGSIEFYYLILPTPDWTIRLSLAVHTNYTSKFGPCLKQTRGKSEPGMDKVMFKERSERNQKYYIPNQKGSQVREY